MKLLSLDLVMGAEGQLTVNYTTDPELSREQMAKIVGKALSEITGLHATSSLLAEAKKLVWLEFNRMVGEGEL